MGIRISNAGLLTTIQDRGRLGYTAQGIQEGGAADKSAFSLANFLVGNSGGEGVFETTLMGLSGVFTTPAVFAVTGADVAPTLNDKPISMNTPHLANTGDVLTSAFAKQGCRSYYAFQGGIHQKEIMGSRSTNAKVGIGGYKGRKLQKYDLIFFGTTTPDIKTARILSEKSKARIAEYFPKNGEVTTLRVVLGLQKDLFTAKGIADFFSSEYTLTNDSDRMGTKLTGTPVETISGSDIVSDGIPLGAIQIPANGLPIIMGVDRQTVGGYAKLGTVISVDMDIIAQLKPSDAVKFKEVSLAEAQEIYKEIYKEIN
ncbi:MAG: biotin-dependent carboxyltransferase family protein [Christensenellaceae bacterium]|jgi:biotin-dependent carboxylase-like uncharacterized protein|nr:biotin-dependent carboxyltransferase family protein [Christensenellaceae bacterium]